MDEDKFLSFVCDCARDIGKEFFIDSGEGRGIDFDGMDCEDLSGWLIDREQVERFKSTPDDNRYDGEFGDCYVFAIWEIVDEKLTIKFRRYDSY